MFNIQYNTATIQLNETNIITFRSKFAVYLQQLHHTPFETQQVMSKAANSSCPGVFGAVFEGDRIEISSRSLARTPAHHPKYCPTLPVLSRHLLV